MLPESLNLVLQDHVRKIKATMIYTHILNRGPAGVRGPADGR